ncbi:hypothetical protein AX15_003210 [Amanita polypyramis BW_CC]|nr:hypothetical protein AX15_003210 [Amanita polypyramis BW_CC]
MSEYWVSKKKYFCKYCEIYIADDAPSRQQHEGGLRHQGNRERFIRNIYKTSEKKKKDLEEEKRELVRVEQAAHVAFAQDVSAGRARPGAASTSASASSAPAIQKPAVKPSNPFANYTTAESLGYKDPDAERVAAEADRRRMQGVIGDWQVVTPSPRPPTPSIEEENVDPSVQIPAKREAEAHSDDDFDRHSKLRKRTVHTGLGEVYDPGIIHIKVKKKESAPSIIEPKDEASSVVKLGDEGPKPAGPHKWVKVQWERPEESSLSNTTEQQLQSGIKKEEDVETSHGDISAETLLKLGSQDAMVTKVEEPPETSTQTTGGSLFKKRRTPASVAINRDRRF